MKINPRFRLAQVVLALVASAAIAADAPQSTPRATLGDSAVEPAWEQGLTVTVGAANADINGASGRAIQAAVDYVARFGGGTVRLLPGTYRLRNAVYLQSKVRLLGSGAETLLVKEPAVTSALAQNSDWFDQEITLADAAGFELGDGICLRVKDANGSTDKAKPAKRTLVARSGNRFKLDRGLRANFWLPRAEVSTLFPLISGEGVSDVAIENLVVDGNREKNGRINGNDSGGIFLQECNRIRIRAVTVRNYNGDGMSWQVCHDLLVENCTSAGNAGHGMHDGSGSQRSIVRNNHLTGNNTGLYLCWGARYAVVEGNVVAGNAIGISIGHHDTDNLVRNNEVAGSKTAGILFRPDAGKAFAARRVRVENNRLVDNGVDGGFAVDIQGGTESVVLAGNEIIETRGLAASTAIHLGAGTKNITLQDNRIQGFKQAIAGMPPAAADSSPE